MRRRLSVTPRQPEAAAEPLGASTAYPQRQRGRMEGPRKVRVIGMEAHRTVRL
jgi:hypothetical protein